MYPAQYYLNTVLGGEHFVTGWGFARDYHKNIQVNISGDPSLQDYVFSMKVLNTLILLTIVLLIAFNIQKSINNLNALLWIIVSHLWFIKTDFFFNDIFLYYYNFIIPINNTSLPE